MAKKDPSLGLSELESETISLFVRLVQLLGLPKSLGQIYGLVYISPHPLSMDELVARLGISLGSVSQGLRHLRTLKAVRSVYVPGQRKDHYAPETEFRQLLTHFIEDQLRPQLDAGQGAIVRLDALTAEAPAEVRAHYRARIDKLRRLHGIAGGLAPAVAKLIQF